MALARWSVGSFAFGNGPTTLLLLTPPAGGVGDAHGGAPPVVDSSCWWCWWCSWRCSCCCCLLLLLVLVILMAVLILLLPPPVVGIDGVPTAVGVGGTPPVVGSSCCCCCWYWCHRRTSLELVWEHQPMSLHGQHQNPLLHCQLVSFPATFGGGHYPAAWNVESGTQAGTRRGDLLCEWFGPNVYIRTTSVPYGMSRTAIMEEQQSK